MPEKKSHTYLKNVSSIFEIIVFTPFVFTIIKYIFVRTFTLVILLFFIYIRVWQLDQPKREKYKAVEVLLNTDERLTKLFVSKFLQYPSLRTLQSHCKSLEFSCNGLVWLSCWLAFIYLFNRDSLFEMQLNFFIGLLIDIFIIAILKSVFRRRRPTAPKDILVLGPDKFSFPSGHASRSSFIALFFMFLYPISKIWWMPLLSWGLSVCLSRILIQRHYILDVVAGIALGLLEVCLLHIIWINEKGSKTFLKFILNDDIPIDDD